MKPHPKLRKTIKWGGAAVTVLLAVALLFSRWYGLMFNTGIGVGIRIEYGEFILSHWEEGNDPYPRYFSCGPHSPPAWLWESWKRDMRYMTMFTLPIWMVLAPSIAVTSAPWLLDARARRRDRGGLDFCPNCNYDRAGLAPDARCPECGTPPKGA